MKNFTQDDFNALNNDFMRDLHHAVYPNPIDARYKARVGGNSIELELIENGKRIFGASIDLYGHQDFSTKEREFKISKGSMGAFNLECQASVSSYKAMAQIIYNFDEVRDIALDYMEQYEVMCKANYID
jgi:hypothetical protein